MTPALKEIGTCSKCGATLYVGQSWCQRCFTKTAAASVQTDTEHVANQQNGASSYDESASASNSSSTKSEIRDAYFEPDTGTVFVGEKTPPTKDVRAQQPTPAKRPKSEATSPPVAASRSEATSPPVANPTHDDESNLNQDEPNTGQWQSAKLASSAWDLARKDEEENFPITRAEIRKAQRELKQERRHKRFSFSFISILLIIVVVAGAIILWNEEFRLTPQKYASSVSSQVSQVNHLISEVTVLTQQVAIAEVPTASQMLQARSYQRRFLTSAKELSLIEAPKSDSLVRNELISGVTHYAKLMGTIDSVSPSNILINSGEFSYDLEDANHLWKTSNHKLGLVYAQIVVSSSILPPIPLNPSTSNPKK